MHIPLKHHLIGILFFLSSMGYAQEPGIDSLDYAAEDSLNSRHLIGFCIGGGMYLPTINPLSHPQYGDFKTNPKASFNVGLNIQLPGRRRMLETGLNVNVTKIGLDYKFNGVSPQDTLNFSTLIFPLYWTTQDTNRSKKFSFGLGILPTIDISKKADKDSRVFSQRNIHLGIGSKLTFTQSAFSAFYEWAIFVHWYPLNMLKPTTLNQESLQYMAMISTGLQFTIR
jgi:hypothetical protein